MRKVVAVMKCLCNKHSISSTCICQTASVKNSRILHASFSYKSKIGNKNNPVAYSLWLHYYLTEAWFLKYGINSTFNQSW